MSSWTGITIKNNITDGWSWTIVLLSWLKLAEPLFDSLSKCQWCSDGLVKKLEEMEKTAGNYRSLMEHTRRLLKAFFDLSQSHRGLYQLLFTVSLGSVSITMHSSLPNFVMSNELNICYHVLFMLDLTNFFCGTVVWNDIANNCDHLSLTTFEMRRIKTRLFEQKLCIVCWCCAIEKYFLSLHNIIDQFS